MKRLSPLALMLTTAISLSACGAPGGTPSPSPNPTTSPSSSPSTSPTPTPSATPATSFDYDLPLISVAKPECQGEPQTVYEVRSDGTFRYYPGDFNPFTEEAPKQMLEKKLSAADLQKLDALLEEIDLAAKFASSTPVPEDGPQTLECRTVLDYTVQVNGQARSFDANSRKFSHTQAYKDAIERLRVQLEAFKNQA